MQLGAKGEALIKSFELLRLVAYKPTPKDKWTIGWGHTGPEVVTGLVWTPVDAEEYFRRDTMKAALEVISGTDVPLTQNQFDALTSFTFNVGVTAAGNSTLYSYVNARNWLGVCGEFPKWNKQEGAVLPGLIARRAAEAALFMEGLV